MSEPTIARIDVSAWDVPMRAPYRSAQRITTTARNVLVTVTLDDGSVGYGESAPATYVTGETQETVRDAARRAAARLAGATARDALVWLKGGGRERMSPGAEGALETAVLDVSARAAGLPLYRYLGAPPDTVPEMATDLSLPILPPDEAGARAAAAYAQGFRAFKIKVGAGDAGEDAARVRAVAAAAPDATLRLDGNQGFTAPQAVAFLAGLDDLIGRIELFEQPTKAGDDDALRAVNADTPASVPVFADESVHTPDDARRLIETGACGGVVLKLAKSGVSGARAIAEATHAAGGKCMFGCMMETRVAIGAALHLAVALGPAVVPLLDLDGHLLVNDEGLISGGLTQRGALLTLDPAAPGLGLSLRAT